MAANTGPDRESRLAPSLWHRSSLRRGWLARLLWPVAWIYGQLSARRRVAYLRHPNRTEKLPVPVIVMGNVLAGGTGKTPATIELVRHLKLAGWNPGVVSRGYGRKDNSLALLPEQPDARLHGDEPSLIRLSTGVPVCVGTQRAAAARHLLNRFPDVDIVICDDGLQHYGLHRDIAIAVFDDRGAGNGWLLPAGPLREPWPPAELDRFSPHLLLRQSSGIGAPAALAIPSGLSCFGAKRRLSETVTWADDQTTLLKDLCHERPTLLAGIAQPQAFFSYIERQGITPGACLALKDHVDAAEIASRLQGVRGTVLCTDKDAVKLFPMWRQMPDRERLRIGSVSLELDLDPLFLGAIDERLARLGFRPALSCAHGHQIA